jgi:hypothetical protein
MVMMVQMTFLFDRQIPKRIRFCKPVLAITNLAHWLLPREQANTNAKSKELKSSRNNKVCCAFLCATPFGQTRRSPAAARFFYFIVALLTNLCFATSRNAYDQYHKKSFYLILNYYDYKS